MTTRTFRNNSFVGTFTRSFANKNRRSLGAARRLSIESLEGREMMTVDYYGGGVMPNVQTQAVFLGSQWSSNATLYNQTGQLEGFLNNLVGGSYMDMITNAGYGIGRGSNTTGIIDGEAINTSYYLTDSAIQSQLVSEVRAGYLQNPSNPDRLFVVYVEPGVAISDGSMTSQKSFLGYHGAFNGYNSYGQVVTYHYAVMAYPGGYNPTATGQGWKSNFDQLTSVTSHEVSEAATDPNRTLGHTGWYDTNYGSLGEIGDIAMRDGTYVTGFDVSWDGYAVQKMINRNDQLIVPSGSSAYSGIYGAANFSSSGMGNAAPIGLNSDPDDVDSDDDDGDDGDLTGPVDQRDDSTDSQKNVNLVNDQPADNDKSNHQAGFDTPWLHNQDGNNAWPINVNQPSSAAAVDEVFRAIGTTGSKDWE